MSTPQVTAWAQAELTALGDADELQLAPRRGDGTLQPSTTSWVVRAGEAIVVSAGGRATSCANRSWPRATPIVADESLTPDSLRSRP
jgi:hypothetical protein